VLAAGVVKPGLGVAVAGFGGHQALQELDHLCPGAGLGGGPGGGVAGGQLLLAAGVVELDGGVLEVASVGQDLPEEVDGRLPAFGVEGS
jgi:hypothetical protein